MTEQEAIKALTGRTLVMRFPITGKEVTRKRLRYVHKQYGSSSLRTFCDVAGSYIQLCLQDVAELAAHGRSSQPHIHYTLKNG